nr:pentapeptide repeat-containing protein [Pseudanabaena sp. FACHB-2040]
MALVIYLPMWQVPNRVTDAKERADIENASRQTVIQGLGGLFFLVTTGLTLRSLRLTEENLQLTEDKQATELFSKAVEMLGNRKQVEVRLGGIYTLERIAKDSPEKLWIVIEVLAAFIRERAPLKAEEPSGGINEYVIPPPISQMIKDTDIEALMLIMPKIYLDPSSTTFKRLRGESDIQVALTAIVRLTQEKEVNQSLNFVETNLIRCNLSGANLHGADLRGANLYKSNLIRTDLSDARFSLAELNRADLSEANLSGAEFGVSTLKGAQLHRANLKGATFLNANLSGSECEQADFSGVGFYHGCLLQFVNFRGAKLVGTTFKDANLLYALFEDADLRDITWDDKTQWPSPKFLKGAKNIPKALKKQLGLTDSPDPQLEGDDKEPESPAESGEGNEPQP